jgi:hypothetical protein
MEWRVLSSAGTGAPGCDDSFNRRLSSTIHTHIVKSPETMLTLSPCFHPAYRKKAGSIRGEIAGRIPLLIQPNDNPMVEDPPFQQKHLVFLAL